MEKVLAIFESNGKMLLENPQTITNGTIPIDIEFNFFIDACKKAIQDQNKIATLGICFNLAPYISNYFPRIDLNIMWNFLIELSSFVTDFPMIYGYLDSITEMTIKSKRIDDSYLSFLANPQTTNNGLKPFLLTALLEYLPTTFIFENTDLFYPLILDSFKINNFLFRSNFLLILSKMNLNKEKISNPLFSSLIWSFAFETSLSDINFPVLAMPLIKLRELIPEFFEMPNDIISEEIKSINEEKLFGLVRLMPFLTANNFQEVFQALLSFISTQNRVEPKLNDAILDSLIIPFDDAAIGYMFSVLRQNLFRIFDDTSIYLFSLYFPLFEDKSKDSGKIITNAIDLAFSSPKSNKSILCFAISQIAEQYVPKSKILQSTIVPNLVGTFSLNDDSCSKFASKSFIKIHQNLPYIKLINLNHYFQLFDNIMKTVPNYSQYCLRKYFKILCYIVSLNSEEDEEDDRSKDEKYDISLIIKFVENYLVNDDFPIQFKAYFIQLCTALIKAYPDEFEPLNEIALGVALNLLHSQFSFSYPIVSEFIFFYPEKIEVLPQIFQSLIEISAGKITQDHKIIRNTSFYAALISQENEGFVYPIELIRQQLSFQDDDKYFWRAIINLKHTFFQYPDEALSDILNEIVSRCKLSSSSEIVDSAFLLLKKLIKHKTELVHNLAFDMLNSTIQERIQLLDHNFPFNYDHRKFKFYKCLTNFIKYYKDNWSVNFSLELVDWIPLTSENILPKIVKCLNVALEVMILPAGIIPVLWSALMNRLCQDWRNTDLANYLLGCLVNMVIEYECDYNEILAQMGSMWNSGINENEDDEEMILILPPIYFDIWANTTAPIDFSLFHIFTDFVQNEQCDSWSYPLMMKYLIKILNREDSELEPDYFIDMARVFAHFILKENPMLDEEFINEIKEALKNCYLKCDLVKTALTQDYAKYPGKINKLEMIFHVL